MSAGSARRAAGAASQGWAVRLLLSAAVVAGMAPVAAQERTSAEPMDHAAMGHAAAGHDVPPAREVVDHSAMGHGEPSRLEAAGQPATHHDLPSMHAGADHAASDAAAPAHGLPADGSLAGHERPAGAAPLEPIPVVTPADRAAAFPELTAHAMHGTSVQWFALLDRLERQDADDGNAIVAEGSGWIGTDLDRIWMRGEIEAPDDGKDATTGQVEVLYGRAIAPWWDAVAGLRHDFGDDPSQTYAAVGVIGLAPYLFEVEATAYFGTSGQTGLGLEAERETLISNRLILQSSVEATLWGKDDPDRGIGSGLGSLQFGVRLRYEFTRRFAPYLGVVHERAYGGTAELRQAGPGDSDETQVVFGLRAWF